MSKKLVHLLGEFFDKNNLQFEIEENETDYDTLNFPIVFEGVNETFSACVSVSADGVMGVHVLLHELKSDEEVILASKMCNEFNQDATYYKAFINEDNFICVEYYILVNKKNITKVFSDLLFLLLEKNNFVKSFSAININA